MGIASCRSRSAEHWGCSSSLLTCVDRSFLTNEVRQTQSAHPCKSFIFIENICIQAFGCCCCSGRGCEHHLPPGGLPTVASSWGNLKKLPVSNLKGNRLFFSLELSLMLYIRGFLMLLPHVHTAAPPRLLLLLGVQRQLQAKKGSTGNNTWVLPPHCSPPARLRVLGPLGPPNS